MRALVKIHGDSGQMSGSKLVKGLMNHIITPKLLSTFTWSGRGEKHIMKNYGAILQVVFETMLAADSSYTLHQFKKDFVVKIMKVAYKGSGEHEQRLDCHLFISIRMNAFCSFL